MSSPAATPAPSHLIEHYLSLITHCLSSNNLSLARLLHCRLLKSGLAAHAVLANRLTHLYSRLGSLPSAINAFADLPFKNLHSYNTLLSSLSLSSTTLPSALRLFDEMPEQNLVSYNTLISSLSRHGRHAQALRLFANMPPHRPHFDRFTVVAVTTACAGLEDLKSLKQLHGAVVLNGVEMNLIMGNVFVDGYGKCGDAEFARKVFDGMRERDVVSWTSLVGGYAKAGRLEEARRVFDEMPVRNAVTWTALVSGYEQNREEEKAIEVFEEMVEAGVVPTPFTLVSVLCSCARLGLIGRGKQMHGYIARRSCFNVYTCNALIDMYSKCGDMGSASKVFDTIPERDVISWNSMVTGFAHNGLGMQSLDVFERMIKVGVRPTHITFLGVLSACSHAGLVSEGRRFLNSMEKDYGVCPSIEHYAAFIDALGRKRQLAEAAELIESLPTRNAGIWGALLGACQVHGDLEVGKRAAETLFSLEPNNGVRYVTLSNIYAAAGQWDEAKRIRVTMKKKGLKKDAGYSWIEVRSVRHVFGAEDKSHYRTKEIYGMLHAVVEQMMEERTHMQCFLLMKEKYKFCNLRIES